MSSDEGGVRSVSLSWSVRRARSSRGTLTGATAAFATAAGFFTVFRAGAFFRALALTFGRAFDARLAERFAVLRLAERPFGAAFLAFLEVLLRFARLAARRLAIARVLSEP